MACKEEHCCTGKRKKEIKEACYSLPSYCQQQTLGAPSLLLPPKEESDKDSICFFSLQGERIHKMENMAEELRTSHCVGSSHGWLVLLDKRADPYLLNPFSSARIQLPTKETFPHILCVSDNGNGYYNVEYSYGVSNCVIRRSMSAKELQESLAVKAVLSSDPSCIKNNHHHKVMVIYGCNSKLAFFKHGDSTWTVLDGKHQPYCDIISIGNQFFALAESGSIEVWDFHFHSSTPIKSIYIQPSFPRNSFPRKMEAETWQTMRDRYSSRWYLVESSGHVLLVVRYVGEFVREDGVAIYEAELLTDEDTHPLICPYRTLQFQVYKLNFLQEKWVEIDSLSDRVIFLGGNHSLSLSARDLPECKKNSIYFTDDYWERMNEDYLYGGHDMGVFNLEDASVESFYHGGLQRIEPPPFWVVPNP